MALKYYKLKKPLFLKRGFFALIKCAWFLIFFEGMLTNRIIGLAAIIIRVLGEMGTVFLSVL